ncbi:MAG: hypothetical protein QG653_2 [Patescibacteria group bacterium]|nr:hypothetical protein [Patescibacteria group bacterium]
MTQYIAKYPKLTTLLFVYVCTFFLFSFLQAFFAEVLAGSSFAGMFISGAMYTYSFTGSIGTSAIVALSESHTPLTLAIFGGVGAGLADVSILRVLRRHGLSQELDSLSQEGAVARGLDSFSFLRSKLVVSLLGIIAIASPLPDELGVLLVERGKIIPVEYLFGVATLANGVGIYALSVFVLYIS